MRRIDADDLKEELRSWLDLPNRDNDARDVALHLISVIDNAPTVEIQSTIKRDVWDLYQRHQSHLGTYVYEFGIELKELLNRYGLAERPQGWIPVSERLPEQGNQSYLVTVDYGNGLVCSCQRFFFNEEIGWNDDSVIAWQPLPEPYEEGGTQ